MKAHTQTFKDNLTTLGKEIDARVTYTIDGVETELNGDTLGSVTPHYEGNILKSVMKQVDIVSDIDIPLNTEINVQFGMRYDTDEYEYIDYGNYIVFSSQKQEDTNNYKIVAYDKMLYAMKDYEELEITYPVTIRDYISAICTKIGLEFANANDTFANYDKEIKQELYANLGYTFRDVLDEIAQVTASTICINKDDELEVRYINQAIAESEQLSGTSFDLESDDAPLTIDEFDGEITQETTNGYQLLKNTNVNSGDNNYWQSYSTFDQENRELTRSTTGTTEVFISHRLSGLESGVAYTLSFYAKSNGYVRRPEWYIYNQSTQGIKHDYFDVTTTYQKYTVTFTTVSDVTYGANSTLRFDNNGSTTSGTEAILYVKDVMLEKGNVAHDYEEFTNGASPNPDYPQEMEITTGLQKINLKGLNLFDMNNYKVFSNVGGNFMSYGNGIISIVPTRMDFVSNTPPMTANPTDSQKITIKTYSVKVNENTQYTLTYDNPNLCRNQILVFEYDDNCSYIKNTSTTNADEKMVYNFTTTSTTKYLMFRFDNEDYNTGAKQFNVQNMMILKGTYSSTNLPIYKDYKYEAKEINLGKNLLNIRNGTYSSAGVEAIVDNGIITLNGTATGTTSFINIPLNTPINIEGYFTISANNDFTLGDTNTWAGFRMADASNNTIGNSVFFNVLNNSSISEVNGKVASKITIRTASGLSYNNNIIKLQYETGSKATSYSPYFEPIELGKIGNYKDRIFKGKGYNLFDKDNATIKEEYAKDDNGNEVANASGNYTTSYTKVKPNTTYTFNYKLTSVVARIYYYDKNKGWISRTSNIITSTNKYTFTTPNNCYYIQFQNVINFINGETQLQEGNEVLLYEPYNAKGKWYLHKEIGKVVLNGSESWVKSSTTNIDRFYIELQNGYFDSYNRLLAYSNYYKYTTNLGVFKVGNIQMGSYQQNTRLFLDYSTYNTTTLAQFKTWLSIHNTIVYYALVTPTITEITSSNYPELYSQLKAIEKAKTFEGVTYIDSTTPISIDYIKQLETIDEDYIKNTRADFGEKYGPINSIVLSRSADSDNIYIKDQDSIDENGLCEVKIKDNQIMNDNDRSDFLPDLLEYLKGIEYYINDFESIGITYLDLLDRYKVVIGDKSYYCVMLNDEVGIHDGLNEIIYTEKPKQNVTDYKKASTTDKQERQTYLMVDKQAQRIDAVVSTQEEFEDSLSSLTIDVDGIKSKVELNYDFVRETSGNNYVSVDDIQQEGLLELKITGTAIGSGNLILHITNNVPEYIELPISTILKQGNVADELSIENIYNEETELYELHCFIDKKLDYIENQIVTRSSTNNFLLNQDSTKLTTESGEDLLLDDYVEGKQDLGIISIPIQEGQHTFSIENFNNLSYYLKYAVLNNITSEFALKKHIVSEINQSAEQIQISADKVSLTGKTIELTSDNININSDNFKVDEEGNMICNNANVNGVINSTNGNVGGWQITDEGLINDSVKIMNNGGATIYTMADLAIVILHIQGTITLSGELLKHYDLNDDGIVDLRDMVLLQNILKINVQ